ncbi:hypothetical protein BEWA_011140 [Theileria equi strain WA]|uniref:Uncharacterized protein n=1 Tax=Theileria equi strain WA TaxID=1537102 RepID=L0B394_THEEQ|nr:hypothetical protein BEWA_011140 [Theileria equi strain WA]AFZ81696.1 hypothetical protein BEWA_011140 [Theileria equi strain WA]|eukprot:XP_004831362.1 hypothetical protein BEWA_011140 [Theileria equi strain WA]
MTSKHSVLRALKWKDAFGKAKFPQLGNEIPEGPGSKYTNFSLQHIMEKYNFIPSMLVQREFLLPLCLKNPTLVQDAFLTTPRYSYTIETNFSHPSGEKPEPLKESAATVTKGH